MYKELCTIFVIFCKSEMNSESKSKKERGLCRRSVVPADKETQEETGISMFSRDREKYINQNSYLLYIQNK